MNHMFNHYKPSITPSFNGISHYKPITWGTPMGKPTDLADPRPMPEIGAVTIPWEKMWRWPHAFIAKVTAILLVVQ